MICLDATTVDKTKEGCVSCPAYSASLHKAQDIFVGGGEDRKLYKLDYPTVIEIENFKGHFGPVHCVRFSPDGELYVSGSEDGTLHLWQTDDLPLEVRGHGDGCRHRHRGQGGRGLHLGLFCILIKTLQRNLHRWLKEPSGTDLELSGIFWNISDDPQMVEILDKDGDGRIHRTR